MGGGREGGVSQSENFQVKHFDEFSALAQNLLGGEWVVLAVDVF